MSERPCCPKCGGPRLVIDCWTCGGTGRVWLGGRVVETLACPTCRAHGAWLVCPVCDAEELAAKKASGESKRRCPTSDEVVGTDGEEASDE